MMPYSRINIGDVFPSPLAKFTKSNITYMVMDKADGMIELRCSYHHPNLQKTFWVKPTHPIFKNRIFNGETQRPEL